MINEQLLLEAETRHDWSFAEIEAIYQLPMNDLLYIAQHVHRKHFDSKKIQTSTLLSIKTGACPEDCAYCPQSGHFDTGLTKEQLLAVEEVVEKAELAKSHGSSRFCMGAAWRSPRAKDMPTVIAMIKAVKDLGMETCMTLGMLNTEQALALKEAGLDYYNHNIDTSEEYYQQIISTRCFQDRLDTLENVRAAGINVCCGGIVGMGESFNDRINFLRELSTLPEHPQSVPVNQLVSVEGTPLGEVEPLDEFEFIRTIATARIIMPKSFVRLSAGRETMSEATQALAFMAGANSIFYGEKLLTTGNPDTLADKALLKKLGMAIMDESDLAAQSESADFVPPKPKEKVLYYPA